MHESSKGIQIMLFTCMVVGALLVILTCIWKLVKLVAMYKMESRIEDLEAMSAAQNNGSLTSAPNIGALMSPKEARHLRKLSILAGFDKKWPRSERSSVSVGGNSSSNGKPFKLGARSGSPFRKMAEMLGRKNSEQIAEQGEMKFAHSNGRPFGHPPPAPQPPVVHRGFIKDCLSPDNDSVHSSPVIGHKSCAIHGSRQSSGRTVSQGCQTIGPPPPPVGFDEDEDEDCHNLSPSSCIESPPSSERPWSSVGLHPHQISPQVPPKGSSWMRCINPNHFHHHHHHHEPPTLPIAMTSHHANQEDEDSVSTTLQAALLFHPPQYQCVICQHNASLYRALSNPSLFSRPLAPTSKKRKEDGLQQPQQPPSGLSAPAAASESRTTTNIDSVSVEDTDDDSDEDDMGQNQVEDEILTPPPALPKMDMHRRLRMSSFSPTDSPDVETHLRDISGLREPLYTDLNSLGGGGKPHNSSNNRANAAAAVHWNASTLERKRSLQDA